MQHVEAHKGDMAMQLNALRAAVLGANDGIVSVAAIILGVAGASEQSGFVVTAGIAGLAAGALSMAVGEYVSVSTQRDSEKAMLDKETKELRDQPQLELAELTTLYESKGVSKETALIVARELTAHDALAAHAEVELHINPKELTNPWSAAFASAISFIVGGVIPLGAFMIPPPEWRVGVAFCAVLVALIVTGSLSAYAGSANKTRATTRVVLGGAFAMLVTWGIGRMFGVIGI